MSFRNILIILMFLFCKLAYGQQQDISFHINSQLLTGKKILKVRRDFYDPYLWVLAENNQVYRVNSITQEIDDYSANFSAYSSLSFVDIAGRSQDTVFIATNSTNVIQYKNGNLRLIGTADGINYTVNSVGIQKQELGPIQHLLMIATSSAFYNYDMNTEKLNLLDPGSSKIFEATYRTEMFKDSSVNFANVDTVDTVRYLPVTHLANQVAFDGFFWEGGKSFGPTATTGYCVSPGIYNYDQFVLFANQFWGNKNGMFQNNTSMALT